MRAYSFSISPISLVLMITMPSACQRICFSGLRYPYSRRLACRRLLGNRTAVIAGALLMTLGHWCWALIQIQPLACIWRWQSFLWLRFIQIKHQLFAWRALRQNDHRRDGGFSLLYAAGNIGLSPRPSPAAWLLSGMDGMLACPCGRRHVYRFVDFLKWSSYFQSTRSMDKKALTSVKFALQYGAG